MSTYERLIYAGVSPEEAVEVIAWYRLQGDDNGLEKYISELEERLVPAI